MLSTKSLSVLSHPSSNIEALLHQTPQILLIPLSNWEMFLALEALGEALKMFFELQNQRNNVWGVDLIWIFKCSLTGLSTLLSLPFIDRGFSPSGLWLMWRLRDQADTQGLPLFSFHHSASYFHPPIACSLPFQPLYFVLDGTKQTCSWSEQIGMSCTSASEQSQSPAVRVAALFFFWGSWVDIFLSMCVAGSLCK